MRVSVSGRFLALLVVMPLVVVVLGGSSQVGRSSATASGTTAASVAASSPKPVFVGAARAPGVYDASVGARDCALLGRSYAAGHGCSRDDCVAGAVPGNPNVGAEVCRRRGGHVYATVVEATTCRALGRAWIASVNFCASNPDRARAVVPHAPQCVGRRSTYVTHAEREGHYDECLTPATVRGLRTVARQEGTSVKHEAGARSAVLCGERPRHVMAGDTCQRDPAQARAAGGVLQIGDSISWRGTDELARLEPAWTVDGYPGRRLVELSGRLAHYAAGHEAPTGLVLELGTNASHGYTFADLRSDLAVLPGTTPVMLVAPYRSLGLGRGATGRVSRWMRVLAATRPHTCVADWRRLAMSHPGVLVDGVHPSSVNERPWAEWIVSRWDRCAGN